MQFTSLRIIATIAAVAIPAALAANFDVTVGANNDFVFSPTNITGAAAGDTITFTFVSRNHSATTTTFDDPCPPPAGGEGPNGFDTGFQDTTNGDQTVVVTLQDSDTHWVACRQAAGAHCHLGMTFAINPTDDMTYDDFLENALNDPIQS